MALFSRNRSDSEGSRTRVDRRVMTMIIVAIFAFGTIHALTGQSGAVTAATDDSLLGVMGTYGETLFIFREDIEDVQLLDALDPGTCVEGEIKKNTMSGIFSNDAFGEYTLHIYSKCEHYIVVEYDGGKILVFNQGNKRLTSKIYEELLETP